MTKKILDGNHGIETINYGKQYIYLPWYFSKATGKRYYRDAKSPFVPKRLECASYLDAYNHVARSRCLPLLYPDKAHS